MKTRFSLIFISFFIFSIVNAQADLFKVIASKGGLVKSSDNWSTLISGKKILANSQIKVLKGGYVSLLHKSGKSIELKNEGEYDANKLAANINTKQQTYSQKYASYVMTGMSGKKGSNQSMDDTGSVTRGKDKKKVGIPNSIRLFASSETNVDSKAANVIKWTELKDVNSYKVQITDLINTVLYEKVVITNSISFNDVNTNLKAGKKYILLVSVENNKDFTPAKCTLKVLSEFETASINDELNNLKNELDSESAIDNLIFAAFYEEKGLFLDAFKHYEKALKLAPNVRDYKKAYDDFTIRIGMD
ncbi:hypothetical protein ACFLQ5_02900 [Bacteroidota bacterium]